MNKQILFISIDGMTDQLGQSQVLPYLVGLSNRGYKIGIVSCEKEINFKKTKNIINELLTKSNIVWSYCFYRTKIPILSQLQNFFNLREITTKEVKSNNNLILHCRSYLPALIGLQLKRKFNCKYIFDMRGFWADERIDGNIWNRKNPLYNYLYNYFKRREIELIDNADCIITLTNNAKKEIQSWPIKRLPDIEVIPCCADITHFVISNNSESIITRTKLNIPENSFVVGYLGSLGTWYMLDEMLNFFVELLKRRPNSFLFFITNDDEKEILKLVEKKNISLPLVLIKPAKRNEVPGYISCLDIGLFFIKPLYSKKGSSPTKLAEFLACGIPIITNTEVGDVDELVSNSHCGLLVSAFTEEAYHSAIAKISDLNKSKQYYRDIALSNFSLDKGVNSYEVVYKKLIS